MTTVVDLDAAKRSNARPLRGDWMDGLLCDSKGSTVPSVANVILILSNDEPWQGVIAWNQFEHSIVFRRAPPWYATDAPAELEPGEVSDTDVTRLQAWLSRRFSMTAKADVCYAALRAVAERSPIHPPRDWLTSLEWDGTPRAELWLANYLGVTPTPYADRVGKYFLVSAVARIMAPGCKADCMLILEGPQGARKSSALRALFGPQWFSDTPLDLADKDRFVGLRGNWCCEFAELDSFARTGVQQHRIKSFLSSPVDQYRPPYGRSLVRAPRSCIFAGTTNDDEYMSDITGGRRFWPVKCGAVNLDAIAADREQLWAEALTMYRAGHHWWPDAAEETTFAPEVAERLASDAWAPAIVSYLAGQLEQFERDLLTQVLPPDVPFVSVADLLTNAIKKPAGQWSRADEIRVGRIVGTNSNWTQIRRKENGQRFRGYKPSAY